MLERDEYGYVLKIVSNFPYHPWWKLTSQLVEGFRDKKKTGLVSSVGVYSPKFGLGSFENPKMIGSGQVDAGSSILLLRRKWPWRARGPTKSASARSGQSPVFLNPIISSGLLRKSSESTRSKILRSEGHL